MLAWSFTHCIAGCTVLYTYLNVASSYNGICHYNRFSRFHNLLKPHCFILRSLSCHTGKTLLQDFLSRWISFPGPSRRTFYSKDYGSLWVLSSRDYSSRWIFDFFSRHVVEERSDQVRFLYLHVVFSLPALMLSQFLSIFSPVSRVSFLALHRDLDCSQRLFLSIPTAFHAFQDSRPSLIFATLHRYVV